MIIQSYIESKNLHLLELILDRYLRYYDKIHVIVYRESGAVHGLIRLCRVFLAIILRDINAVVQCVIRLLHRVRSPRSLDFLVPFLVPSNGRFRRIRQHDSVGGFFLSPPYCIMCYLRWLHRCMLHTLQPYTDLGIRFLLRWSYIIRMKLLKRLYFCLFFREELNISCTFGCFAFFHTIRKSHYLFMNYGRCIIDEFL